MSGEARPVSIRAHHGMCLAFFQGRGYSDSFARHMGEIQKELRENPSILLLDSTDAVCTACPNNHSGVCEAAGKVARYDRGVLELCGLRAGTELRWEEFAGLVARNILSAGKRREICGDCQWDGMCGGVSAEAPKG